MSAPTYTAADFTQGLLALLPIGRAWPREIDAVIPQVIATQAPTYARLHARANYLLVDAFPTTTVELLPEWEATLGLPDPCAGPDPTIAQRRAHVVARLTQQNGPSIPSLTAYAAALGYTITIQEFAPAVAGRFRAGQPCRGRAWAFAWYVVSPATVVTPFRAGMGRAGDPLATWGGDVLACEMQRLAPAHTVPAFTYTGTYLAGGWDSSPGWDSSGWAA